MLANFFGKSTPISFIALLLLLIIYFIEGVVVHSATVFATQGALGLIAKGLFLELCYLFFFVFILRKNKLTLDHVFGILLVISFFGLFPEVLWDTSQLIQATLLLIFLRKLFSLRTAVNLIAKFFDMGFWLGVLVLLYPPTVVYVLLMYVGVLMFQTLNVRSLVLPILGMVTPAILYYTYCLWFVSEAYFWGLFQKPFTFSWSTIPQFSYTTPLIIVLILAVLVVLFKSVSVYGVSGNYRKFWTLILLHFLISGGLVLGNSEATAGMLIHLFFPLAIILANGIESVPIKWVKEGLLLLCILAPFLSLIA